MVLFIYCWIQFANFLRKFVFVFTGDIDWFISHLSDFDFKITLTSQNELGNILSASVFWKKEFV